jgi:exosortase/archaeosortase family protein
VSGPAARVLVFAAAFSLFRLVPEWLIPASTWRVVQEVTAYLAGSVLRTFGASVRLAGCSVELGTSVTNVTPECLPYTAWALGVALIVLSSRLSSAARLLWSLVMVATLFGLNVFRVVIVALLAQHGSALLEPVHVHALPAALALASVDLWLVAERVGPHG